MCGRKCLCVVVLAVLVAIATGCSSYKEPTLPATETALLKGKSGCTVSGVDGQHVYDMAITVAGAIGGNEVRVTPGVHQIRVSQVVNNGTWTYNRSLLCEKGHTYIIEPESMIGGSIVMRDANTGQVLQTVPHVYAVPGTTLPTATTAPTTLPAEVATVPQAAPTYVQAPDSTDDDAARPRIQIHAGRVYSSSDSSGVGIKADAEITLDNVPDQLFVFQGVLTDAKGVPLKDAAGDFRGSRLVKTGDDEDTDDYSIVIPCQRLYTWKPLPSVVYVQLTLVDSNGKVRAKHPLISYVVTGR